jgi:hypothetical protein
VGGCREEVALKKIDASCVLNPKLSMPSYRRRRRRRRRSRERGRLLTVSSNAY